MGDITVLYLWSTGHVYSFRRLVYLYCISMETHGASGVMC